MLRRYNALHPRVERALGLGRSVSSDVLRHDGTLLDSRPVSSSGVTTADTNRAVGEIRRYLYRGHLYLIDVLWSVDGKPESGIAREEVEYLGVGMRAECMNCQKMGKIAWEWLVPARRAAKIMRMGLDDPRCPRCGNETDMWEYVTAADVRKDGLRDIAEGYVVYAALHPRVKRAMGLGRDSIVLTGMEPGSNYYVLDRTSGKELARGRAAGGDVTVPFSCAPGGSEVLVRVRKAGWLPLELGILAGVGKATITVVQRPDPIYEGYAVLHPRVERVLGLSERVPRDKMDFGKRFSRCKECGAHIDLALGAWPPGRFSDRDGSKDYPRAPGDWDDVCEVCGYGEAYAALHPRVRAAILPSPPKKGCPACGGGPVVRGPTSDLDVDSYHLLRCEQCGWSTVVSGGLPSGDVYGGSLHPRFRDALGPRAGPVERKRITAGKRVVGFDPETGDYLAVEFDVVWNEIPGKTWCELSMGGSGGDVVTEGRHEEMVEDYWHNADLEDEFGYLADEAGIKGPARRKEYLDGVAEDLKRDGYPYEQDHYGSHYVFHLSAGGQVLEGLERIPAVDGREGDKRFLLDGWREYHLKSVPKSVLDDMLERFGHFPSFDDFEEGLYEKGWEAVK